MITTRDCATPSAEGARAGLAAIVHAAGALYLGLGGGICAKYSRSDSASPTSPSYGAGA